MLKLQDLASHLYWKHEMKNRERVLSMFNPEASEFTVYNLVDVNREVFKSDHPAYYHPAPGRGPTEEAKEDVNADAKGHVNADVNVKEQLADDGTDLDTSFPDFGWEHAVSVAFEFCCSVFAFFGAREGLGHP